MVSSLGFQQELQILWRGKKQKRDYYLFWPIQLLSRLIIYVLAQKQHILNADQNTFFFFFLVSDYKVESLHQKLPFLKMLKSHILSV